MGTTTSTDDDAYIAQREADLARFSARESGNQNIPQRSGGPASGYYQMEDSSRGGSGTWETAAAWAGLPRLPDGTYGRAMDYSPGDQHAAAVALYDRRGAQPWAMSDPGRVPTVNARASMADTSTPDSGLLAMPAVGASDDDVARVLHQLNMGSQQSDSGKEQSFISRLGEAFGGGGGGLTGDAREAAGTRSLMNFGMGLLANSGYHPVRTTMGQALAAGLQGAQESEIGSQDLAYSQQQAQRDQVKNALTILGAQQGRQIQAGQLGVAQQQARTGQQRATTEAGSLAVQQAEERRKQTETDIELQRQKQLLAAPPLFAPTGPAPVAPSAVPPTTTPPAGGPAPVQGDQLPTGGGTQTGAITPPGPPSSLVAGPGAPTTTQPPGQMPETAGDVAAILGGMKGAGAKDVGDTQVAQAGNAVPSLPPSPPVIPDGSKPFVFQLPPVPASVSPDLTDAEKANLAERYRLALLNKDPTAAEAVRKDMQALQTEKQNKFTDWSNKQQEQQQSAWMQANKSYLEMQKDENTQRLAAKQKILEGLDATSQTSHDGLAQLQTLRTLSKAAGQAGFLSMPGMEPVRDWMVRNNIATPEETQKFAAQDALNSATNRLMTTLRNGTGFQRTTNMDLGFLEKAGPGGAWTPEQYRDARLGFLITTFDHQQKYTEAVRSRVADGMPIGQAQREADAEVGSAIHQVPKDAQGSDVGKSIWDNVERGGFYKDQGGNLRIFNPKEGATRPE
jgi:hypothetical protein